jgi:hypothetical protein
MARVIAGYQMTKAFPAQKNVAGSAPMRPEYGHRRSGQRELFNSGHRRGGHREDPDHEKTTGEVIQLPIEPALPPHPPEPEVKPAPDEPGLVMARHLAGNDKSDAALERLLDDLDDLNTPATEDEPKRRNAVPIAPFLTSRLIDSPFYRAAAAYQWVQSFLNSRDPFRPGAVYSERF